MAHTLNTKSDWLSFRTDIEIHSLSFYLGKIHTQLGEMAKDFIKKVEDEAKEIEDDEEREQYYEWQQDEYWYYEAIFPQIFLNSFHTNAYSLLETEINHIATRIGEKKKQKFTVSDVRTGDYLDSAVYYIQKLTGIDAKKINRHCWNDLKDAQRLRNIIVHSNGSINKTSDISLAKKLNVYNESKKEVVITYVYCQNFLKNLKTFFTGIYKETKTGNHL